MAGKTDKNITYSIAELAKEFDVTHRTIRFYEDEGLLQPQRQGANGQTRIYSNGDRTRLRLTLRGKRLGFSLSEIKEILDMYEGPGGNKAQLTRFLDTLTRHKEVLAQQMQDLKDQLAELAQQEEQCKKLLADKKS